MALLTLIRGGGDLGSGIALRLYRSGLRIAIAELPEPLVVRRKVSFAEAVYENEVTVEGITARRVADPTDTLRILNVFSKKQVPVLIDPEGESIQALHPAVVVDARMLKERVPLPTTKVNLLIGLGPGFVPGENCHCAIETNRGPRMGRVYWSGKPEENTGSPEPVMGRTDRVLRAPVQGKLTALAEIGEIVQEGQVVAEVDGQPVVSPFRGVLRGLIHPGNLVEKGAKIGDVDPRADPQLAEMVSDKALALGGAVLEAILSRPELRPQLWQ